MEEKTEMAKLGFPEIPSGHLILSNMDLFFIPSLTVHCDFSLSLNGSQITGVLSCILLIQRMDHQSHGLPELKKLMLVVGNKNSAVFSPDWHHCLFGAFTMEANLPLFFSNHIL